MAKKITKTEPELKSVSIADYAILCGISKTAVYNRIGLKEIKTHREKGFSGKMINLSKYPAMPEKPRGRRSFENS